MRYLSHCHATPIAFNPCQLTFLPPFLVPNINSQPYIVHCDIIVHVTIRLAIYSSYRWSISTNCLSRTVVKHLWPWTEDKLFTITLQCCGRCSMSVNLASLFHLTQTQIKSLQHLTQMHQNCCQCHKTEQAVNFFFVRINSTRINCKKLELSND